MILTRAVEDNNVERVQFLLTKNRKNYNVAELCRCLWCACKHGYATIVALLLQQGVPVNHRSVYGKTYLIVAVGAEADVSDAVIIRIAADLLACGVDVEARDDFKKTALHYAVHFGRTQLLKWLAPHFHMEILCELLSEAVLKNDVPLARTFLTLGGDVDVASVHSTYPVIIAVCKNFYEMLRMLAYWGAKLDFAVGENRMTPLHFAAHLTHEALAFLLERGCNTEVRTAAGNTPLHYATFSYRPENVALLLARGANANAANQRGVTPLLEACRNKSVEMVEMIDLLLNAGADPNQADERSNTPIAEASLWKGFELVDLLLQRGAHINPTNAENPLMKVASKQPDFQQIWGLLRRGAYVPKTPWFQKINDPYVSLELVAWAFSARADAVAYFFCFVYGEEKGVRPVPVLRRLTGACGLYPIRRRLAACLVSERATIRATIRDLCDHFDD